MHVYTKKERIHNVEAHVRVGLCKDPAPVSKTVAPFAHLFVRKWKFSKQISKRMRNSANMLELN